MNVLIELMSAGDLQNSLPGVLAFALAAAVTGAVIQVVTQRLARKASLGLERNPEKVQVDGAGAQAHGAEPGIGQAQHLENKRWFGGIGERQDCLLVTVMAFHASLHGP